ncbi:hypothetical protein ABZ260_08875 [Streptosporangium sp. NPDC006013]|uniref:hypothetical protein n=1 Tax=Streptosporangium sp. NPDC006013 TaxID=3155596 RepID=UPI0033AFC756
MRVVVALLVLLSAACAPSEAEPFSPVDLPAETSASGAAQPSPGGSARTGPRVETVQVAPGVRVVVEWPAEPDADTTAMIELLRDYFVGVFRAVTSGGGDTDYLGLVERDASPDAYAWVQAFLDQRRSVRGTARLYALNVSSTYGAGAELEACVDESKMRLIDSSTGKQVPEQPVWTKKPFLQAATMRHHDDGSRRIVLFRNAELPHERAKGCLR